MNSGKSIFLISNCTASKSRGNGEIITLGEFQGSTEDKFRDWTKAVEKSKDTTPARDLYAGDYWRRIIDSESTLEGKCSLWVISAGIGLIHADTQIPNYSATFVEKNENSVAQDVSGKIAWWQLLINWRRKKSGIGTISDLARQNPDAVFLVVISATYLSVIMDDLLKLRQILSSADNLIIICSGLRKNKNLGNSLLPLDARFQTLVGGARSSLNSRIVLHIIKKFKNKKITAKSLRSYLLGVEKTLTSLVKYDRKKMSDNDLVDFIKKESTEKKPSASSLLKKLRNTGSACEQKRFVNIYKTINKAE